MEGCGVSLEEFQAWLWEQINRPKRMVKAIDSKGNLIECDADKLLHISPERAIAMIQSCPQLVNMLVDVL